MVEDEIKKEDHGESINPDDLMAMWEEALKESAMAQSASEDTAPSSEYSHITASQPKEVSQAQPMAFKELSPIKATEAPKELDFILDIPLEISVEIGRTRMLIKDLLKLSQGSIVELERLAGEPVDIFVNGKLMAKGEVVVVNDRFGVRITEIISAQDRVKRLGG